MALIIRVIRVIRSYNKNHQRPQELPCSWGRLRFGMSALRQCFSLTLTGNHKKHHHDQQENFYFQHPC